MPEVSFVIGGRDYSVACEPGEEAQLKQAAALLDTEAQTLVKALGRVPEPRMLLMSGLMLADRTTELALKAHAHEKEIAELKQRLQAAEAAAPSGADAEDLEAAKAEATAAIAALETATKRVEALAANANGG